MYNARVQHYMVHDENMKNFSARSDKKKLILFVNLCVSACFTQCHVKASHLLARTTFYRDEVACKKIHNSFSKRFNGGDRTILRRLLTVSLVPFKDAHITEIIASDTGGGVVGAKGPEKKEEMGVEETQADIGEKNDIIFS